MKELLHCYYNCLCSLIFLYIFQDDTVQECMQTSNSESISSSTTSSASPDPEIEIMSRDNNNNNKNQKTPVAAWILVMLIFLNMIQNNSSGSVIIEMFQLYLRQTVVNSKRTKPYTKAIMIFCLTLAGYSARAYKFIRGVSKNSLPSMSTLRKYRKRVDGSPGFSSAALQMVRNKVAEMNKISRKLYVSLSCDDMSIRQHVWFTGTTFYGYEDLGDGPGKNPAKHVMMVMATAVNMKWKLPIGYFLIPDSFSAEKRAELIRNCIYHVNNTGAVLTSLVMDNCPVNYATFRRL